MIGETGNTQPVRIQCDWFALCDRAATYYVVHPVLGDVPTCADCIDKLDMWHHAHSLPGYERARR